MKAVLVGVLIPVPFIWAFFGFPLALFSACGALALTGAISFAVNRGWIK